MYFIKLFHDFICHLTDKNVYNFDYHVLVISYAFNRYLVTHLMGADLNNIVRTQKLSDDHVQFLVYQILRGLKYIHSAGIIHRVK